MTTKQTAWEFLRELHSVCSFTSREIPGKRASNSELKRWFQNKSVVVNGERIDWNEPMDFPIISFVLFPKHPVTLF